LGDTVGLPAAPVTPTLVTPLTVVMTFTSIAVSEIANAGPDYV